MLSELGLRGLAHGNLTLGAAVQLAHDLESALTQRAPPMHSTETVPPSSSSSTGPQEREPPQLQRPAPLRLNPLRCPSERVVCLSPGANVRVAFNHPNPAEPNSALLLVFVGGQLGAHDNAALSLLAQVFFKLASLSYILSLIFLLCVMRSSSCVYHVSLLQ